MTRAAHAGQVAVVLVVIAFVVRPLARKWWRGFIAEEDRIEREISEAHRPYTELLEECEVARWLREPDEHVEGDGSGWRNTDEGDEEGIRDVA